MDTKILTTENNDIKIAADILKNGGNVILPTETVYGLGADALNSSAVKNTFVAKGRPSDNPLIVHISSLDMLKDIVSEIPDTARRLMNKFWPGPLTIIMKKCKNVPYETTGGLDTVAVRMPKSEAARRIIAEAGIPISAPSANLSGKPSPTTARHCIDDMMGRVDAIVVGDDCEIGLESTVVDLSGEHPVLLRPGGITLEQLEEVLGIVECATSLKLGEPPKSPGLKYKHYSPNAEVVILSGTYDEVSEYVKENAKTKKIGMLVFDEFPKISDVVTISLGSRNLPYDAGNRLFSALRQMDDLTVDVVFAPEIPDNGMWLAVRNRLYRAAGEKIIDLSSRGNNKKQILFVCTGNTCRSPMAEAIFNNIARDKGFATSAGVGSEGEPVSQNSVEVMSEIGIDISHMKSKLVTREMIDTADLVLTMTKYHKDAVVSLFGNIDKIKTLAEAAGEIGDVSDPYGQGLDVYRDCRDTLCNMIEKVVKAL